MHILKNKIPTPVNTDIVIPNDNNKGTNPPVKNAGRNNNRKTQKSIFEYAGSTTLYLIRAV